MTKLDQLDLDHQKYGPVSCELKFGIATLCLWQKSSANYKDAANFDIQTKLIERDVTLTILAVSTEAISYRTLASVAAERVNTSELARVSTVGLALVNI